MTIEYKKVNHIHYSDVDLVKLLEQKDKQIELLNTKLRCTEAALKPIQIELNDARKLIEKKDKQIECLRDVLEEISKTDTCTSLDYIWMNNWRNNTKSMAEKALKEFKEMGL